MAKIHEQLKAVKEDIGSIGKAHSADKYKFRGIEDALNICGPIFTKHGVTVVPRVVEDSMTAVEGKGGRADYYSRLRMEVDFVSSEDDSKITVVTVGHGLDFGGDKSANKAMSAAFKYAIFLGLQIPVAAKALADSDRPKKRRENDAPGNDINRITQPLTAIENAYDESALDRYRASIEKRTANGEFSATDSKVLMAAIETRRLAVRELPINGKTPVGAKS